MTNKIREIQDLLAEEGITASEVAIINIAIEIVQKSPKSNESFIEEFRRKERLELEQERYITNKALGKRDNV